MSEKQAAEPQTVAPSAEAFAAYEAERQRQDAGGSAREDVRPEAEEDTGAAPETSGDTGAPPETGDSDGDADAGEKAAPKRDGDDLPAGVKRRLQRANRARDAAREETAEWKRRYDALLAERGNDAETPAKADSTVSDKPVPAAEYEYDYPEEADYVTGPDDADGLAAFLEDVERWEKNIPLKGGAVKKKAAADSAPQGPPQGQPQRQPQRAGPQQPMQDEVDGMFTDLRETLEEAEGVDDDLAQHFFEQIGTGKFRLSYQMLEWMSDNDDAVKVAAEFVKSPRKANRIYRSPAAKHAKLLADLAAGNTAKADSRSDNRSGKTVVQNLNGRRSADPSKALMAAGSFREYEALRSQLDAR